MDGVSSVSSSTPPASPPPVEKAQESTKAQEVQSTPVPGPGKEGYIIDITG